VAELDGSVVGLLSIHRSTGTHFPAPIFDPAMVAPDVFASSDRAANGYLLIGGNTELVAGYAVREGFDDASRARIGSALVTAAFREAEDRGLVGAAVYVRDEQRPEFTGDPARTGRAACQVDELAEMMVVGPGIDAYLRSLDHARRSVVRRDLTRLASLSLVGAAVPALDVIDEAARLVVEVKQRHGLADHPRLAALRLRHWARDTPGERLAFAVRDDEGRMLAVTFGCHHDDVLELYEIGLSDSVHRQLVYAEVLVYAPLRYAAGKGCRVVQLGLGASRPKDLRGARFSPVWAVGRKECGDGG
jgi:hypothetical protein